MTDQTNEHDRHIVVGVDGSQGSRTALACAMTQARLTGLTVEAVAAWQEPVMLLGDGYPIGETGGRSPRTRHLRRDAARVGQPTLHPARPVPVFVVPH